MDHYYVVVHNWSRTVVAFCPACSGFWSWQYRRDLFDKTGGWAGKKKLALQNTQKWKGSATACKKDERGKVM